MPLLKYAKSLCYFYFIYSFSQFLLAIAIEQSLFPVIFFLVSLIYFIFFVDIYLFLVFVSFYSFYYTKKNPFSFYIRSPLPYSHIYYHNHSPASFLTHFPPWSAVLDLKTFSRYALCSPFLSNTFTFSFLPTSSSIPFLTTIFLHFDLLFLFIPLCTWCQWRNISFRLIAISPS